MVRRMNKRKLASLLGVSLLYTNPQYTDQARRKGKSGKKLIQAIVMQYVMLALIFTVLYGFMLFTVDFSKMPGFFTMYVGLFGLLAMSQGVSVIYNVFFESKDLEAYLPLPFRQSEIFVSKILAVTLTVVPYVLPLFVLFSLTAWQAGNWLVFSIVSGLLAFVLLLGILLFICSLIVLGLTRTKVFQKHKKLMTTGLMVLTTVLSIVGILFMQFSGNTSNIEQGIEVLDRTPFIPLLPVHWAITNPFSQSGLLGWGLLIGLFMILAFTIKIFFLPRLYEQLMNVSTLETFKKKKQKIGQTTPQLLRSYNWQLIKEPGVAMQIFSSSVIIPIVMLISFGSVLNQIAGSGMLPNRLVGVVFVSGVFLAYLSCNQASFVANFISLDRENYDFICTLPLSKKAYLKEKFLIGFLIQVIISGGTILAASLFLKLSLLLTIFGVLGATLGSFVMSLIYFARDYRLLLTNWTSVTQLFQRGGGTILMSIFIALGTIIGGILIGGYAFATYLYPFWPLLLSVMSGVLLVSGGIVYYYKRKFWDQLD